MSLCSFRKKRWELQLKKKNRVHKTHTTETGGHVWRKSRLSELPHSHWIQHTYVAYRWISHSTKRKEKKEHFLLPKSMGISNYFFVPIFFDRVGQCVCVPRLVFFPFSSYISKWRELAHRKKILESLLHFTIGKFFIFRSMCVCRLPIR